MGENEGLVLPNGLLPNEADSVVRILDTERWLKAEGRIAELIKCIQPNQPSEDRRNAVANYVQRLIMKCFPCQVFTFGSVPLKTYLPDGDIDLTAFSTNQNLKDTWAHQVRDMLENEERSENAEFRVKEVQYIQAEVKIIKCLVENIVVDISFNQLGGLCTLCFLEQVDNLIKQDHLFKRSIILIKAWCYYESRILGAHHGLISTYALETLVLYIFHVFNKSFAGPLEVLYRFLEFFSKFDWENFCVSLWGPVPISSLPDVTAEPPRKDGVESPLGKLFRDCSTEYAVFPNGQENQGQPFTSKHFNVIDPLRVNNNLGRSVSKGNFFRIRSAFAFGAKRLARLLDCPKEDLCNEVNQFFLNTWDRHGSGHRPDAPKNDLWCLKLSIPEQPHEFEDVRNHSSSGTPGHEAESDVMHGSRSVLSQHSNNYSESTSRSSEVSSVSQSQNHRAYSNSNNTRLSDQNRNDIGSNQATKFDRSQRSSKDESRISDLQGRYLFARTQSSPELTDTYGEAFSQGRRSRGPDSGKGHTSARLDCNWRKNVEADNSMSHGNRLSVEDPLSVRQSSPHKSLDSVGDSSSASNINHNDLGLSAISEEVTSAFGTEDLHQEEQDLVNMIASSAGIGFNGQVHLPLSLASMGYAHRTFGGIVPTNIPTMDFPWSPNMQFPHSLVSPPFAHYFPGMGLATNPDDAGESGNDDVGALEANAGMAEHDFWHEQDRSFSSGFNLDNGSFEIHQSDDKQPLTSAGYHFDNSSQLGGSGNSLRVQETFAKEARGSLREDHVDNSQYHRNRETEVHFDDRNSTSRPFTGSYRSRTSPDSSWEGSSVKGPKSARENRSRKPATFSMPNALHSKGKNISEHSSQVDDDKDWNLVSNVGSEMVDRSVGPQPSGSLHISRHQVPEYESAHSSGSESPVPMAPMLLAPDSQQQGTDDSGVLPFAFYPTGPPVPFVTMVPIYNFPAEAGTSDASTSQFNGKEGLDKIDSGLTSGSSEAADQSEVLNSSSFVRVSSGEPLEHKPDILNSDFASHWQNLQFGRLCQNSRSTAPMPYPSPVMMPPVYIQGRVPWDGLGRPLSTDMNLFSQLMSYGPRYVPAAPLQSVPNRASNIYQPYVGEMPRYRGGTGTYLPNPKVSVRDRRSTSSRKGNYNYDKSDHYGDREGNWNSSKIRAGGRGHGRNQSEKQGSRLDRLSNESRADRTRNSFRHEEFPSYQSQNGPIRSSMANGGSVNLPFGMYSLSSANPGGVSSNGPSIPSVVMLYPYDHGAGGYGSAEQLEFGSLGPASFSGINEVSRTNEGTRVSVGFEDQRIHNNSAQMSSPDQPSSPRFQR